MHILQPPLLSYNEFFHLDEHARLHLVLEAINAEALLRVLAEVCDLRGRQERSSRLAR